MPNRRRAKTPPVLTVRPRPIDRRRAILSIGGLAVPAALGRSGLSAFKREGDGATPIAAMAILSGYVRAGRRPFPKSTLPLVVTTRRLWWCDAPAHALYNRPSRIRPPASVEAMWRPDDLYDLCLVLDWNVRSRARGRGSAIFFHLARPGFSPTEGCVAIRRADMIRLMAILRPGSRMIVRP